MQLRDKLNETIKADSRNNCKKIENLKSKI